MELDDLTQKALTIRAKYAQFEEQTYGKKWTGEQLAQGFVGDVGDLMKLIMAREGLRIIPDVESKLAHELSDCLWSILVLASHYKVDLESSFLKTMDDLEQHIDAKLDAAEKDISHKE